jgi:hypothetical protein
MSETAVQRRACVVVVFMNYHTNGGIHMNTKFSYYSSGSETLPVALSVHSRPS